MSSRRFLRTLVSLACLLALAAAGSLWAQAPRQQSAAVFPLGIQRGTSAELALKGAGLSDGKALFFASEGLSAKPGQTGVFTVTAAREARAGHSDVWAWTPTGLRGPGRLVVDDLPEILEKGYNETPQSCPTVPVPCAVSGAINPATDRDCFRFDLTAGQHVSITCRSASLGGGVLPALTLYGPDGRELLHDDGKSAEPALHFAAATKGRYAVQIEDRAYRPEPPGLYRLELTSGPRLLAAFPSVLTRGKARAVTLYGFELPGGEPVEGQPVSGLQQVRVHVAAPQTGDPDGGGWTPVSAALPESFSYRHPGIQGGVRFGLTDLAVVLETDKPHQTFATAQPLTFPCEVAGRFLQPDEVDWYRFTARKGQAVWFEAVGERAGLAMDLDVTVHSAPRVPLATFGDTAHPKELPARCPQETLDPMGAWTAPADGTYYLAVRDLYGTVAAGIERGYRLAVEPQHEQVRVIALPAPGAAGALTVPAGGQGSLQMVAVRRGGHAKPIRVQAAGLPAGLAAKEVILAPNAPTTTWTVTAAKDAPSWLGTLSLTAETEVDGVPCKVPVAAAAVEREGKHSKVRLCSAIVAAVTSAGAAPPTKP